MVQGLSPTHDVPSGWARRIALSSAAPFARHFTVFAVSRARGLKPGESMSDIARHLCDAIEHDVGEPVFLQGTSTGGSVVLQLAVDRPDLVRRLVVTASAYRLGPGGRALQARMAELTRAGDGEGAWAEVTAGMLPARLRRPVLPLARLATRRMAPDDPTDLLVTLEAEDVFDVEADLSRITAPTLVIGGSKDPFYPRAMFEDTAAGIPDGRAHIFEGWGHLRSSASGATASLTLGFLLAGVREGAAPRSSREEGASMARLGTNPTERIPVTTTYHGVEVTEEYRWLEDATSEQTRTWTEAQHERTMAYLRGLPSYDDIRRRAEEILTADATSYTDPQRGGDLTFARKFQPPHQQPFLVALTDLTDAATERVVVDPNAIDPSGATTIDWYMPSPDGRLVAVSLSSHGTEDGTLHVYDATAGDTVDKEIPRVQHGTAGGSLAWRGDGAGFWYTRYPAPGERPVEDAGFYQEVWFHGLGEGEDHQELAGAFADDRIVEHYLSSSPDGRWVLDRAQKGDGGEWQLFVRPQDEGGQWWMLADIPDKVADASFGSGGIFLRSRRDAPHGQILALPLTPGAAAADAVVVVPHTALTIDGFAVSDRRLWVVDIDGGPSGLRVFDHDGAALGPVELPAVCAVDGLSRLGDDQVVYAVETFTSPRSWWVASDDEPAPRPTVLSTTTPLDFSGIEVRRVYATADDGVQVPISLLARKGVPDAGPVPTLLTAYGGYGISLKPSFQPESLLWLEQGAVLAVANIRGGGEYGEEWHHAGRLLTKQRCFDDFLACARHLVATGMTTVERLAIMGGSNGGLLMGAVLTQHPDVARAVIAAVPVLDMLRVELHPNGAFNVTEYGTVTDPASFDALYAYSPYHRVVDGTSYPAVLLTAGEFDPRVDGYHAKKMTARLQAATSSNEPVLLRIEAGGHGVGQSLDQMVGILTDIDAFAFAQLGVAWSAPAG